MRPEAREAPQDRDLAMDVSPWDPSELGVHAVVGSLVRRPRAVAVGVFDGVHRGHQRLLAEIADHPAPTVVTFDPHPRTYLGQPVRLLTTLQRRLELLREYGAHDIVVLRFDRRLADMSAARWAQLVLGGIGAEQIIVGEDFRFGAGRLGDVALLRSLGFGVTPVPLLDGVGSTLVRDHLVGGDLDAAAEALGRRPEVELSLDGYVCSSARRSVRWVPADHKLQLPPPGSYAGVLHGAPVRLQLRSAGSGVEAHISLAVSLATVDLGRPLRVSLARRLADSDRLGPDTAPEF